MGNRNKIIILIVVLALLAIAGGYYMYSKKPVQPVEQPKAENKVQVKEVSVSEAPAGLPENLPIEPGSQVIQNYSATSSGNSIQGTRKFTTNKTLTEAVKTYSDFFAKTAWIVVDTQKDDGTESALLKRNNSTILILARKDSTLGKNVVELTLTEPIKK